MAEQQIGEQRLRQFHLPYFESNIVVSLRGVLTLLEQLEVPIPLQIRLAIIGAQGYVGHISRYDHPENKIIDRNELFFDAVTLDSWGVDPGIFLKSVFDQIWNACGYQYSYSYDADGAWKPRMDS
ncbi:MAG: hypothetical protein HC914_20645 [Chloroflexaceae bacterium]|nr:hypothetical protein [Chloroflexaceae bacterium]